MAVTAVRTARKRCVKRQDILKVPELQEYIHHVRVMFVEQETTEKLRSALHSAKFTERGRKSGIGGVGPGLGMLNGLHNGAKNCV